MADFKEAEHPRDEEGKFSSTGDTIDSATQYFIDEAKKRGFETGRYSQSTNRYGGRSNYFTLTSKNNFSSIRISDHFKNADYRTENAWITGIDSDDLKKQTDAYMDKFSKSVSESSVHEKKGKELSSNPEFVEDYKRFLKKKGNESPSKTEGRKKELIDKYGIGDSIDKRSFLDGLSFMQEKKNAKQLPTTIYCRHMESGLCGYQDERVLITAETMKRMSPSFANKPIYVGHNPAVGQFMRGLINELPDDADGYVINSFYNPLDGWLWAKMLITSDAAHEAVKSGWAVSNAYLPQAYAGEAGQHHNVDYDREIVEAQFTHLAIVPDPRYENAKIFTVDEYNAYQQERESALKELENSKSKGSPKKMFKFFRNEKKEVQGNEVSETDFVELTNGKTISIKEMVDAVEKQNQAERDSAAVLAAAEKVNMDAEVDVSGGKMKVGELINRYTELQQKANAADKKDEDDVEKDNASEDDADEEKENAEEEKKKDEEEKKNAKDDQERFNSLKKAHLKTQDAVIPVEISIDTVARGKARYGSQTN